MSHAVAHLIRKLQPEIDWVTPESMVQPPQAIQDEGWLSFLNVIGDPIFLDTKLAY